MSIARAIVSQRDHYGQTIAAGKAAVGILRAGVEGKRLTLKAKEAQWLDRLERELDSLVGEESNLLAEMREQHGNEFDPGSYGL